MVRNKRLKNVRKALEKNVLKWFEISVRKTFKKRQQNVRKALEKTFFKRFFAGAE